MPLIKWTDYRALLITFFHLYSFPFTGSHLPVINEWIKQKLYDVTVSSNRGYVFACWQFPAGVYTGDGAGFGLFIMFVCQYCRDWALTHTGNGSAPSWMTKPSMTCVRTWGLTMAWGGLFSPFCGVLPVTVGTSLSFPEVMAGGGVPTAALGLFAVPPPDGEKKQKQNGSI